MGEEPPMLPARQELRALAGAMATAPPTAWDIPARTKAGRPLEVRLHAARLEDDSGPVAGAMCVLQDITLEKSMTRELQGYHTRLQALAVKIARVEEQERRRLAMQVEPREGEGMRVTLLVPLAGPPEGAD